MFDYRRVPEGHDSAVEETLRLAIDRSYAGQGWQLSTGPHALTQPLLDGACPETADFRELLEVGAAHLAMAKRAAREQSRQAAVQARALAMFARCRPAGRLDRPEVEVGAAAAASRAARPAVLTEVSEWAVDEVMAALGLSARTAGQVLADSLTLVEQLPATLAALESGLIGWPQARMLADLLAPLTDEVRAGVEAGLLAGAAHQTLAQLTATARRAVLRADAAAAAQRLATAVRDRAVRMLPDDDGMATLSAVLPGPVAAACYAALEAYAEDVAVPDDERTKAQRMVDCLADLILRPGVNGPVQVRLPVVAPAPTLTGGDEPGEVNGEPVPALMVRELAYALGLLPRPEPAEPEQPAEAEATGPEHPADPDTATDRPEANTREPAAEPAPMEVPEPAGDRRLSATERAAVDLARLLRSPATAGTALAQQPAIAVVDEISGQLLALTTAAEIRRVATCQRKACRTGRQPCTHRPRGPGLGPPAPSSGYVPADQLATFVRARDRRCRFPGCRARAVRCDLDHNIPWPHGTTSEDNLCCLCRHHHRLSHQAPGWAMRRLDDGGLQWTTPGGEQLITYPPRYGTDDPPPPAVPAPTAPASTRASQPPRTLRERVLGRPRRPGEPEDDPPPF